MPCQMGVLARGGKGEGREGEEGEGNEMEKEGKGWVGLQDVEQ